MSLLGGVLPVTGVTFFMFCLLAIIAVGYLLGRVTIKGVSLGTAGVFIISLVFGALFYEALAAETPEYTKNALKLMETLGLIMFVTSVGFIAGPKFFGNMKKNIKSYVLLGLVIILSGGLAAIICIFIGRGMNIAEPKELTAMVSGLLSGALTSTPAFSAAKSTVDAAYEDFVSVGYGIAYIFGVIGVVLFVQIIPKLVGADMDKERAKLTMAADGTEKKPYTGSLVEMDPYGIMMFALAAVVGILIGSLKLPLSSKGLAGTTFSLTTTGGCLFAALVFGHFGRCGRISLMPPAKTLKVFREMGLVLFLIGAGISGGAKFVEEFHIIYFFFGVIMTILPLILGFLFAKYILKLSLLNNLGSITGGMTSTPALGTLINVAGTEDIAAAYAATYPIALIAVVFVAQFLIILF